MRFHCALLLSLLALVGCGGDEPEQATREEFVAAADEVCAEHNERMGEQYAELTGGGRPSDEAFDEFVVEYADSYEAMVQDLEELPKPRDDADVDRYMDRLKRNADGLQEGAEDPSAESFIQSHQNSMREANSLASALGLEVCSPIDGF